MSGKSKLPIAVRGDVSTSKVIENKNDSVKKPSKIPKFIFRSVRPSNLHEAVDQLVSKTVAAPKSKNTIKPTAKNETMGPKNVQTASKPPKTTKILADKNITNVQKEVDPKMNSHGDGLEKPMLLRTTSFVELRHSEKNSERNVLPIRSKSTLGSTTTPRTQVPLKNTHNPRNQMRTNLPGVDVSEKSKLESFERDKDKLRAFQSTFMGQYENPSTKLKQSYKIINLVKDTNCKLIVNNDDFVRLPNNLPRESVKTFKDSVEETLKSGLDLLDKHFADKKTNWQTDREAIRDKLKQHQQRKFNELSTCIDGLCKHPSNFEAELTRALKELEENQRKCEELKMEKANCIKDLENSMQKTIDDLVSSKENSVNEFLKEIEELKKCIKDLENDKKKTEKNGVFLKGQVTQLKQELENEKEKTEKNSIFLQDQVAQLKQELENEKEKTEKNSIFLEDQVAQLKQELEKSKIENINQLHIIADSETETEPSKDTSSLSLSEIEEKHSKQIEETQDDLEVLKDQNNLLNDLLKIRGETINTLKTQQTEWSAEMEATQFQNFEIQIEITEIKKQMNNKCDDFDRLKNTVDQKDKDIHNLQHNLKLCEERLKRNLKLQDELKQKINDQKLEIFELKMKEKLRILFEPATSAGIDYNEPPLDEEN